MHNLHFNKIVDDKISDRSVGVELTLDDFQKVSDQVPFLADLKPSGKYVMEDVHKVCILNISFISINNFLVSLMLLSVWYSPIGFYYMLCQRFSSWVDNDYFDRLEEHQQSFATFWSLDIWMGIVWLVCKFGFSLVQETWDSTVIVNETKLSLVTGKTLAENAETFLPLANGQVWWLFIS